jgi:hypothetical protein
MELHFHPAILVAEDFLTLRAGYGRGLYSGYSRFARHALRTVGQRDGNTTKAILIVEPRCLAGAVIAFEAGIVLDTREKITGVRVEMPLQF